MFDKYLFLNNFSNLSFLATFMGPFLLNQFDCTDCFVIGLLTLYIWGFLVCSYWWTLNNRVVSIDELGETGFTENAWQTLICQKLVKMVPKTINYFMTNFSLSLVCHFLMRQRNWQIFDNLIPKVCNFWNPFWAHFYQINYISPDFLVINLWLNCLTKSYLK